MSPISIHKYMTGGGYLSRDQSFHWHGSISNQPRNPADIETSMVADMDVLATVGV